MPPPPTRKKKEQEAAVKKEYGVANPISFSGPTEADIHTNALLERLLMKSAVYESAEEMAKREEILHLLDQFSPGLYWHASSSSCDSDYCHTEQSKS
ncbi:nuclear poly(A) polymerase 4-like protein [Tanacetum coccineum]